MPAGAADQIPYRANHKGSGLLLLIIAKLALVARRVESGDEVSG